MNKKEIKQPKEKKKINIERLLLVTFAVLVLFESIVLFNLIFTINGKKSSISGHEWVNTYTYNNSKYKISLKFGKSNKFNYSIYKDDEEDLNSRMDGKYFVVDDKVVIEYTQQDETLSTVIYIEDDHLCMSYKNCEETSRYYEIHNKKALEYKKYGQDNKANETEDEDTSYLNNKPEYKKVSEPTIYIFHGDGCPHCADLLDWIKGYKYKKSYKIVKYEVWKNQENSQLMSKVGKYLDADAGGVPFVVIGDETISGFNESSTPSEITKALDKAYDNISKNKYYDVIETVKK